MGFKNAKKKFIEALKSGDIHHEARLAWGKNWIAEKRISEEEAISIISQARGQDSPEPTPHHFDPSVEVWIFKPLYKNERWYVKGYWYEEELHIVELYFISFHPSQGT